MELLRITAAILLLVSMGIATCNAQTDAATNQLITWSSTASPNKTRATSSLGAFVPTLTASQSPSQHVGPILLTDTTYIENMAHFVRERIPERVVHPRGSGAWGKFTVTGDIRRLSKADLFKNIGKETPIFVRFSLTVGTAGSADTTPSQGRGFAIKFYTPAGNWDLVGLSLPVFPIRDPMLFPSLIHSSRFNPLTNLPDWNMFWDFHSLRPETTKATLMAFSDMGTPANYRQMDGWGVHTFKLVNAKNEITYVRFVYLSQQQAANMTTAEAIRLSGTDPGFYTRDLYNAIENKNFPKWDMFVQTMQPNETASRNFAFDPTQEWPTDEFPVQKFGEIELNRNPDGFFNEVEQVAFSPGNLVPGIEMSPDRLLQGRSFAYPDAHRHRLGANFAQLPVNVPRNRGKILKNYQRDGPGCLFSQGGGPNYFPNSFNGPQPTTTFEAPGDIVNGRIGRFDTVQAFDNFSQAKVFYKELPEAEKQRLVANLVDGVLSTAHVSIQNRMLKDIFANVDVDLSNRVRSRLVTAAASAGNNNNGGSLLEPAMPMPESVMPISKSATPAPEIATRPEPPTTTPAPTKPPAPARICNTIIRNLNQIEIFQFAIFCLTNHRLNFKECIEQLQTPITICKNNVF